MQKRHFDAFAKVIKESDQGFQVQIAMARLVITVASKDNARFDAQRFLKACGLDGVGV